ncbi:GNAT family N-acetyltransferase [Flavitalea flava]
MGNENKEKAPYEVVNNEKEQQLEIFAEDNKAYLVYRMYKDSIAFMHTDVPDALEGKGIGSTLARAAFAYADSLKKPVLVYCPFVASWLLKHEEYKKQLDPQNYTK